MKYMNQNWGRAALAGYGLALGMLGNVGDAAALSLDCGADDEAYRENPPLHGNPSNVTAPHDGAVDVALNVRIWGGFHGGEVRLIGPEGEVESERHYLPLGGLTSGGDGLPMLTPSAPLLPNTLYRVDAEYDGRDGQPPERRAWQFTTGNRMDDEPPALPMVTVNTSSHDVSLDLVFDGILVGEPEPSLGAFESLDDLLMPLGFEYGDWARDPADPLIRWITQQPVLLLGSHACGWPLGRRDSARFGVFDDAGNFSGWTSVTDLALPPELPQVSTGRDDLSYLTPPARPAADEQADRSPACSLGRGASGAPGLWADLPWAVLALAIGRRAAKRAPTRRRPAKRSWPASGHISQSTTHHTTATSTPHRYCGAPSSMIQRSCTNERTNGTARGNPKNRASSSPG